MDYLETRITAVERPASAHVLIRFAGERPIAGEPGQFVMVRGDWGTHPVLARAFSLVEAGAAGAILVRVVGQGTALLEAADAGDVLHVLGPQGRGFSSPTAQRRVVLVAGGIGVAPLIFMAERLAAEGRAPTFLYGARSARDLPLRDRVAAASTELSITTEDGSAGERGLIISPLARVFGSGEPVQIFACGPEGMLEAVARLAVTAGAPCEVALESPMACGMGTCKGCAVLAADREYRYVCSDGPVFESTEIYGGAR
jgi:dihydroorotate dehydrogenase electron transfer subunit